MAKKKKKIAPRIPGEQHEIVLKRLSKELEQTIKTSALGAREVFRYNDWRWYENMASPSFNEIAATYRELITDLNRKTGYWSRLEYVETGRLGVRRLPEDHTAFELYVIVGDTYSEALT